MDRAPFGLPREGVTSCREILRSGHVRRRLSPTPRPARLTLIRMKPLRRLLLPALLLGAAGSAAAAPVFGNDDLRRNGAVSRHVWTPDIATGEVAGLRVSAGLALGLRHTVKAQLGRSVTPALTVELQGGSSLSLLPGSEGGAMLVLQTRH